MTTQPTNGKIFAAIPAIIAEVGPVGKNSVNQQQKYRYRSADDICDALHDSLGKHKVFATCEILDRQVTERESKSGGVLVYVNMKMKYTFHAEDGSSVSTETWGEAMDSGDKASNKSLTAGYKYALLQVFCLMGHEDSETDSPEPTPQQRSQQIARDHGMTTGDKVKPNGRKTAEEKADETEAEELRLYEKYKKAFACVWTSSGMDRVLTNLSEEGTQPLKAKLKICHEEAERRVRLSEAESIDADTMAEIGDWMAKTPKLSDLESFCEWAFNAQPSPFTETQKTTLYRWLEREQQKHAKPVGA